MPQKQTQMPYKDIFLFWLMENLRDIGHAVAGAFVYLLYGATRRKIDFKKAAISFIVGVIFSVYATRQLCAVVTWLDAGFAGFFLGMMGKNMTDFVLQYDLQIIADAMLAFFKLKK